MDDNNNPTTSDQNQPQGQPMGDQPVTTPMDQPTPQTPADQPISSPESAPQAPITPTFEPEVGEGNQGGQNPTGGSTPGM